MIFLLFFCLFLLKNLTIILYSWYLGNFHAKLRAELSSTYFKGYMNLPKLFHTRSNISELIKNITVETDYFVGALSAFQKAILELVMLITITILHEPLPHSKNLHFHVPDYYIYGIPTAIIIGLIFLTYFGSRFGLESRKRTQALNKLELILAKEHELESIGLQAAAAAHSLGTPLSTITVVAKELNKEMGNKSKYSKDISLILSQTKRCSEILKKLSQEQLSEDTFLTDIKIEDLLNEIVRSFNEISEKKILLNVKDNKINPNIEKTLEITYGLRNFIGNAVKYSKSLVEIYLISNDKFTEVIVEDDGPGFSDDITAVLGEPYIRSKDRNISSKSGLGLGTFIGKTLLERMKAQVLFSRSKKIKGAKVTISWHTNSFTSI